MDSREFRILIKHCFLMGKNTVDTKQWLDKYYGKLAPAKSTICTWFAEFKCGRSRTDDAPRSGRRNDAVNSETIKKVQRMLLVDCRARVREIADQIGISLKSLKNYTLNGYRFNLIRIKKSIEPSNLSLV